MILTLAADKRGFAHVECATFKDAKAVIEAHEAYPMRDKAQRLIRINYDDSNPPSKVLCISAFGGTAEELEDIFEQHDCNSQVVRVSTCE